MKILCIHTPCGPHYVRSGWQKVFQAAGHEFIFWQQNRTPVFDAFDKVQPDIFIGTTYDLDEATYKCIKERPNMKVILFGSCWGPYLKNIPLDKYPIVVAGEEEKKRLERLKKETGKPDFVFIHYTDKWIDELMSGWKDAGIQPVGIQNAADIYTYYRGEYDEKLACDIAFVGGYWEYKGRNLAPYMLQLCQPDKKYKVKIFGNQRWPNIPQYLGLINDNQVKNLFVSAGICPNISEPHSTDFGFDIIERPFKVLSSGGFCMSDEVSSLRELFTEEEIPTFSSPANMLEKIDYYLKNPEERNAIAAAGRREVLKKHTYHNRVAQMLFKLNLADEATKVLEMKEKYLAS